MVKDTEYYDLLKVPSNASQQEIKKAFRTLAMEHHPDKGGDPEVFKQVNTAYKVLSEPESRKKYDLYGKDSTSGGGGGGGMDSFTNMFNMFNMGGFGGLGNMFNRFQNAKNKTLEITYNRGVSLEELCQNKSISIKVTRSRLCECQIGKNLNESPVCTGCNGSGNITQIRQIGPGMVQHINTQCGNCNGNGKIIQGCDSCKNGVIQDPKVFKVNVSLNAMENGIRFENDGNHTPGLEPGDFVVNLILNKHPKFNVHGRNDLVYTRKTTLKECLCGYRESLELPNGKVLELAIPYVDVNENKIYPGHGIENGNLLIHHIIDIPVLSPEKRDALREIL